MKSSILYHQENKFRIVVEKTFSYLIKSKKDDDKVTFSKQLLKILPEVKKYINGRLNTAIKKGHFSKEKYKDDDIVNQLFIEIYKHIEEIPNKKDFYLWLFKKTNTLLDDIIIDEEFDDFFFKNIDTYSKPEWDAMHEKFSTNGDGDLLMIEELDDSSYKKDDYTLSDVFIEDKEKQIVEKLDKDLNQEAINRHFQLVLHNLPLAMQTVFELYTKRFLSIEEIAKLRNTTISEVEKILNDTKEALKISIFNRYTDISKIS